MLTAMLELGQRAYSVPMAIHLGRISFVKFIRGPMKDEDRCVSEVLVFVSAGQSPVDAMIGQRSTSVLTFYTSTISALERCSLLLSSKHTA